MKLRKSIGFLSFFLLPITLNYFSPVLIVQGSFEKTFTAMHIVFGLMILSAVFFGGAWCSYICPFGVLQELLPNSKLKHGRFKNLKLITGLIFFLLIITPIVIYGFQKVVIPYHMEDTKVTMDSVHGLVLYYIITCSIILITKVLGKRTWCRYICPMYIFNYIGIKVGQLLRLPSLKMVSKKENCIGCKKCSGHCLMGLDVVNMVKENKWNKNECIQCGECISACKCDVIKRKWGRR